MVFAVSVTRKRTVSASLSRATLPASTSPPMRKGRFCGASWAATCVGVKKNTRFDWKAFSTSAVATPSAATPPAIHNARLVLGFKFALLFDAAQRAGAAHPQRDDLGHDRHGRRAVAHRQEVAVAHGAPAASARTQWVRASRSRMMARTRVSAAPIAYAQLASAISTIACSIATCMEVPLKLTLEPWCSVFHHWTEK